MCFHQEFRLKCVSSLIPATHQTPREQRWTRFWFFSFVETLICSLVYKIITSFLLMVFEFFFYFWLIKATKMFWATALFWWNLCLCYWLYGLYFFSLADGNIRFFSFGWISFFSLCLSQQILNDFFFLQCLCKVIISIESMLWFKVSL